MWAQRKRRIEGFTLVEVIVVASIVSILAVVLSLRSTGVNTVALNEAADRMRRDLNHAQSLARSYSAALNFTASGTGYSVTCRSTNYLDSANSPRLCATANVAVSDPATGGSTGVSSFGSSISVSSTSMSFDTVGRPYSGGTLATTNIVFTLTQGSKTATVTVRPVSGFVDVSYAS